MVLKLQRTFYYPIRHAIRTKHNNSLLDGLPSNMPYFSRSLKYTIFVNNKKIYIFHSRFSISNKWKIIVFNKQQNTYVESVEYHVNGLGISVNLLFKNMIYFLLELLLMLHVNDSYML